MSITERDTDPLHSGAWKLRYQLKSRHAANSFFRTLTIVLEGDNYGIQISAIRGDDFSLTFSATVTINNKQYFGDIIVEFGNE